MRLNLLAMDEIAKVSMQIQKKKIVPTKRPMVTLLTPVTLASVIHARKVAVKQTGQGQESNRKLRLEISEPLESHFFFVCTPKYTSPIAIIICTARPEARMFCVVSTGMTPTR